MKTLPQPPGVYRMINAQGDVLYVGKARDLKKRVTTYTQPYRLAMRLQRMVAETAAMEFVATHTEVEALLLEANLIKRYMPRYNVLLRDDKSFPYIVITGDHPIPQITKHRGARNRPGEYFGPFASAGAVNRTIVALQRAFLLRNCSDSMFADRTRPVPAVPDQALLRALRAAHLGRGLWRAGARGARLPDRQEPRDPGPPGAGDARRPATRWTSSAPRGCATASRR